jgi:MFS family permease
MEIVNIYLTLIPNYHLYQCISSKLNDLARCGISPYFSLDQISSMTNSAIETDRASRYVLASICLAALVLPLGFTGGAVAAPAIGRDLGGDPVALNWITNAFMLSFGSLLMAGGALADKFGRKRIFVSGMVLLIAVSLALSFAPSVLWIDILRAVQGVAGAAALSSGSAALAQQFEGHARTRAFSLLGTSFGVGLAFGPLLVGMLIDTLGWRSVFATTAAIGVIALIFGVPRLRESCDPGASGLDWPGTISFSGTLVLFTSAVILAPQSGWNSSLILALLLASLTLLIAFIVNERRVTRPMLDLSLFRFPRFIGVQLLPIGTCYCYIILVVLLPLRFINAEGLSEIDAGLLMIALSAPMLVVPLIAAVLTRRISAGILCGIGFLISAIGLYWLSLIDINGAKFAVVPPMLLIGIGAGIPWGLMDGLAVSVVPNERSGMAAGIFNTTRVASEGIALAICIAMLSVFAQNALESSMPKTAVIAATSMAQAAQYLATGNLHGAAIALPEVDSHLLVGSYASAFQGLMHILTAITALIALMTFLFFSADRSSRSSQQHAGADLLVHQGSD